MFSKIQKKQEMDEMKRRSYGNKTARVALAVFCALILTGCGLSGEKAEEPEKEQQSQIENTEAEAEGDKAENIIDIIENEESGEETAEADLTEADLTEEDSTEDEEQQDDADGGTVSRPEPKTRPEGFALELDSEDWGLGFGEPGTQPVGNASTEDLAWYHAYYMGDGSEKALYLTFDCGYENGNTEPILDALKKHNAPATFFVVGHFLETEPELVKRMVEEGHAVGNHTYHHPDMASISDMESFGNEVNDVAQLFREITGKELSPYYRPPQGKCNVRNLEMAEELGYYTIFWSLAYVDWNQDNQPSHEEAFDKLTTRVHPGAVVLLHNTSSTNGEILDELLTKWEEMGYSFRPLSELVNEE